MSTILCDDLFLDGAEDIHRQQSPTKSLMLEAELCAWSKTPTPAYNEADQTIIFYDWDETLFPTEAIVNGWGFALPRKDDDDRVMSLQQENDIEAWRKALRDVLETACTLSSKCCIVTNAVRPWVHQCINEFAPELTQLIDNMTIVYAREHLKNTRSLLYRRMTQVNPARHGTSPSDLEVQSALTMAKYFAMKDKVTEFYSQYKQQTWKNILSFGDSAYECDALKDVAFRRVPPAEKTERLRAKCLLLPTCPSVTELALRLRFHKIMLKTYVDFDGDFDLDLTLRSHPLAEIGNALGLPRLASLPWLSHAWGLEKEPAAKDAEIALAAVEEIVEHHERKRARSPGTTTTTTMQSIPTPSTEDSESEESTSSCGSHPLQGRFSL